MRKKVLYKQRLLTLSDRTVLLPVRDYMKTHTDDRKHVGVFLLMVLPVNSPLLLYTDSSF